MAETKKRSFLSRFLFWIAAFLVAALLVVCYLSAIINPVKAWHLTVVGLLYIPILLLAVIFLFWAMFRRAGISGLLLLALLPSVFLVGRYYQFKGNEVERYEGGLKVVSYNTGLFVHDRTGKKLSRQDLTDSVATFLRGTGADVICLQEFLLPAKTDVASYFRSRFPGYNAEYWLLHSGPEGMAGNAILSRLPILGKGKIDFDSSTNMALYTDILAQGVKFRVYNCHFESYNITIGAMAKSLKDEVELEAKERKIKRSILRRADQVESVLKSMDECPIQCMVTGDFNENPLSYTYRRMIKGRKDSFVEVGKGLGATYSGLWPFLRIDYILYPADLAPLWHEVRKVKYSDHYPIVAAFNLK